MKIVTCKKITRYIHRHTSETCRIGYQTCLFLKLTGNSYLYIREAYPISYISGDLQYIVNKLYVYLT